MKKKFTIWGIVLISAFGLSYFLPNNIVSLIEVLFLLSYNMWTYLNFFRDKKAWWVIVKSIISIIVGYFLTQVLSNIVINQFMH